ncbi:hypothetical protein ACET3Z_014522 [Daucus carota]
MLKEIRENSHARALDIFKKERHLGLFNIDEVAVAIALKACRGDLRFGCQMHGFAVTSGLFGYLTVSNSLMNMYCKAGKFSLAFSMFENLDVLDVVSWNTILSGFQDGEDALSFACKMNSSEFKFDAVTYNVVLSHCADNEEFCFGSQLHGLVRKCGIAVSLFNEMRGDGVYPNDVTFITLVHAITTHVMMYEGKTVHGFCIKTSFVSEMNVANSFITMYARFEAIEDSKRVFDELECREIVSWNALISGYEQNRMYQEAVQTFLLARLHLRPNHYSFGSVLSAIGASESISLRHGEMSHSFLVKLGLNKDPIVLNALLDIQFITQTISLGMIVTSALIIWKGLMCVTGSESPVVVVLSGSMEPGFKRGDILFLHMSKDPIRAGEIVVFNIDGREIPIVHRVIKVHERPDTGEVEVLTKGDNNLGDDRLLYAQGQLWLQRHHVMGRAVGFLPYVGWVTIIMTEKPIIKYILIGALGLLVITSKE